MCLWMGLLLGRLVVVTRRTRLCLWMCVRRRSVKGGGGLTRHTRMCLWMFLLLLGRLVVATAVVLMVFTIVVSG